MIRKTERWITKKINKRLEGDYIVWELQYIKRITFWLFWIIPIFSKDMIVKGEYESK